MKVQIVYIQRFRRQIYHVAIEAVQFYLLLSSYLPYGHLDVLARKDRQIRESFRDLERVYLIR